MFGYVLKLECIGDNYVQAGKKIVNGQPVRISNRTLMAISMHKKTPWCAEIIGFTPSAALERRFVKGMKTYAEANGVGSRGVYLFFVLGDGIYEIFSRETWARSRRYFARVRGSVLTEINEQEACRALAEKASTY